VNKVKVGEILEGRYRIERLIASGGQANVYRGTHLVLDRPVAIKHLRASSSPEVHARMTKRFEQEARLISSLRDPHTITLYDFGSMADGSLFMIFEYIDGMSLKELLETEGKLAPHRVAKILRQTLSSLQEAHSFGVLHRDIKPANIMLYEHANRPDQVKLLDFGIAKIVRDSDAFSHESLTGANSLVGTPRYIAPEAYQEGSELTTSSDIYSLGLVAYELLTGEPAIKGATPVDVFRSHLTLEDLQLPRSIPLSQGLRSIIERMLLKEQFARYQTAEQILSDMHRWFSSLQRNFDSDSYMAYTPGEMTLMEGSEVSDTRALSGDELDEMILPQVEVMPLDEDEIDIDPMPSIQVEPLSASEALSSISMNTPNPDLETTSERLAREQLRRAISSRRNRIIERPPEEKPPEKDTSPMLDVRTQILTNTSNIDALLFNDSAKQSAEAAAIEPEPATRELDDDEEENTSRDDDTMNVNLKDKLARDANLKGTNWNAEPSEAFDDENENEDEDEPATDHSVPIDGAYADPDEKTHMLTELPPLKKSAILKRKRKRRWKENDNSD
jgi:serine/threonine protein kinase